MNDAWCTRQMAVRSCGRRADMAIYAFDRRESHVQCPREHLLTDRCTICPLAVIHLGSVQGYARRSTGLLQTCMSKTKAVGARLVYLVRVLCPSTAADSRFRWVRIPTTALLCHHLSPRTLDGCVQV